MKKLFLALFLLALSLSVVFFVRADQIDDLQKQIDAYLREKSGKESSRQELLTQLNNIKVGIANAGEEIVQKEIEVKKGEEALEYQQELLATRVNSYYKNTTRSSINFITILFSANLSDSLRDFFYQQSVVDRDRDTITKVVLYIKNLEEIKANLIKEKNQLASLKVEVDKQEQQLASDISQLSQKIAELSAQQQQLINQRLASLNIPKSAGTGAPACVDDRDTDPGFSPRLAFYTYGVPNRIGLNQYGAKARASFQGHEDILRAYYNDISFETRDNINIKVQGRGEMPLETYLLGICEMPESWPMEALKSQVVAARSYALAYTNNGANEICTTDSCQVYCGEKTGQWKTAVQETAGKVMVQGGSPIKAWYSSTHGGYVFSSGEIGWSGTSWTKHAIDASGGIGSFSDLQSNAYDKESPWFYCDWGSRSGYNKTAWLKSNEVADIVNVILLARADSSTGDHLYQTDKPHPYGGEVWNEERVKQELRSRSITPFNNVYDVSVSADFNSGKSTSISLSGDGRSESFSGDEFKNWFNLRAPANIQIVGPLYNVEKR